jgi:hypothetical protein
VQFTIEIYTSTTDGAEKLLHRATVSRINPLAAQKEALRLLVAWKNRKANSARVLNGLGDELYRIV